MNIIIPKKSNIMQCLVFYIFGVLYMQIIEFCLPYTVTKFFLLALILLVMYGSIKGVIKLRYYVLGASIVGVFYLLIYFLSIRYIFSYVYPPIIIAVFSLIMVDNLPKEVNCYNWEKIDRFVFGYLIINTILYLVKYPASFQDTGIQMQFKGALPHSNMFGAVMVSLFILLFWQETKLAYVNKILIFFLVLCTLSRTYIVIILACMALDILALFVKKIEFSFKIIISGSLFVLFGFQMFNLLVEKIPAFSRFKSFKFGGNGRQYLQESYYAVIKNSDLKELLIGIPMVKPYLDGIRIEFTHSFTENSFIGIFLLFGIIGIFMLVYIIYRILKINNKGPVIYMVIVVCVSMITQDTLLSVQTGMLLVFSLICMVCQGSKPQYVKDNYTVLNNSNS